MFVTEIKKQLFRPEISEASALPADAKQPTCIVDEIGDEFQVVIALNGAPKSDLQIYASEDGSRLHIIGEKYYHDTIDRFLWTLEMPKTCEWRLVSFKESHGFYLIRIPKRKFWSRLSSTFAPAPEMSAGF